VPQAFPNRLGSLTESESHPAISNRGSSINYVQASGAGGWSRNYSFLSFFLSFFPYMVEILPQNFFKTKLLISRHLVKKLFEVQRTPLKLTYFRQNFRVGARNFPRETDDPADRSFIRKRNQ